MSLEDLRMFVQSCEAGSLSAVARDMGLTQSAVSQHIRRLERRLDVALFERGRRGVTPTAAGAVLFDAARSALGELDQAERLIERLRVGDAGTLRVATGGTTLRHFMTKPLASFRRRHPGVRFEYVSVNSTRQCVEALRDDRADIAYITIHGNTTVEERPTIKSRWVVVVQEDDPLAAMTKLKGPDLAALRPIAMPATTTARSQLERHLTALGVHLDFAATVDDWDTAVLLADVGVGHAIVPSLWVHDLKQHRGLRAVPLEVIEPVTFGWAARRWSTLPEPAHTFVGFVDDEIAKYRSPLIEVL